MGKKNTLIIASDSEQGVVVQRWKRVRRERREELGQTCEGSREMSGGSMNLGFLPLSFFLSVRKPPYYQIYFKLVEF
jgi:hypothetical protein